MSAVTVFKSTQDQLSAPPNGWGDLGGLEVVLPPAQGPQQVVTVLFNAPSLFIEAVSDMNIGFQVLRYQGRGQPKPTTIAITHALAPAGEKGYRTVSINCCIPYGDVEGSRIKVIWGAFGQGTAIINDPASRGNPGAILTAIMTS